MMTSAAQPVENVFVVVVESAAVISPATGSVLHAGNAVSRVLQIAPDASRAMIKIGRNLGQRISR